VAATLIVGPTPSLSRGAAQECSPWRQPWELKAPNDRSPGGAEETFFRPSGAWFAFVDHRTTYVVGYILAPLRGLQKTMCRQIFEARSATRPRATLFRVTR
jgi:hypothetical protein